MMTKQQSIISLLLITISLLFSTQLNANTLFKCTQANGMTVFSDQPCSTTAYTQLKLYAGLVAENNQAENNNQKFSRRETSKQLIIGKWQRNDFVYNLQADGFIRAEKYEDGKLVAWRAGTWLLEHAKLSIYFTQYSSNSFKYQDKNENFIAGVVKWGTDKNTFSVRSGGVLKYFKKISHETASR